MENVKNHFEEEAKEFDNLILKLIPYYHEMIDSLIASLPFNTINSIKVLDLGCGTGNVSLAVKKRFPNSRITCVDLAENMIEMAQLKLSEYDDIQYQVADFSEMVFDYEYDAVVSSLAMHHLRTDEDKKKLYIKIYDALQDGGVFYNADWILGPNNYLNNVYLEKWKEFMLKRVPLAEIEGKWLPKHYDEDVPSKLINHIDWLKDIGFKDVDVVWKYYGNAVFGGVKQLEI